MEYLLTTERELTTRLSKDIIKVQISEMPVWGITNRNNVGLCAFKQMTAAF